MKVRCSLQDLRSSNRSKNKTILKKVCQAPVSKSKYIYGFFLFKMAVGDKFFKKFSVVGIR